MESGAGQVELRDVTRENFESLIALEVAEDQRGFLHSNVESLAWAYVAPESRPLAIYAGDTPVGLVAYGYFPSDGRCWISHFMVDERRQSRGIGRAALERLLARMAADSGGGSIAVGVNPDNAVALRLYESFGFSDTGSRQDGEVIMRRPGTAAPGHAAPLGGTDASSTGA